jgi:pimeloyl-ACP methyl ester carboxylesterase
MVSRAESEYPTGTEGDATFFTQRILYGDLAVVIRRFPPVEGAPTDGRPFVLVHGIGVSSRYFHPSAAQLAKYGTVYLVDLPGYGSAPNPRRDVTISDHANVLLAPTMDPAARGFWHATGRLMRDIITREPPAVNAIVSIDYFFRCGIPYFLRQTKHPLADRMEDRLPLLDVKALVVRGDRDCICPEQWTREVARLLKDGSYAEVAGPHVIMFTDPPRVAALIANHAHA